MKDSCAFLTNSLSNLCDSYKIKTNKLENFEHKGTILDNTNLCFYNPDLTFWEFMDLEINEPDYWDLYTTYCLGGRVVVSQSVSV